MRFLCLADMHGHDRNIPALLDEAKDQGPDCIIMCGDITHGGSEREAEPIIERLRGAGLPLFAVHGNMDTSDVCRYLDRTGVGIHGKSVLFRNVSITGLGGGTISPFFTPTEYGEDEIGRILGGTKPDTGAGSLRVLVSHVPPSDCALDMIKSGKHVGSKQVRSFIEKNGIDLCVCGHIHESRGEDRVGRCVCVNCGSFREGHFCIVTVDENSSKTDITWRYSN